MGYITVAEARAEGIPVPPAGPSDVQLQAAINTWSQFIDKACRQWFESRSLTLLVDGNSSDILFLPIPILTITGLYINGDFTTVLDPMYYEVYNGRALPDDRPNPRLKMKHEKRDIFAGTYWEDYPLFSKGQRNQKLIGTFGYLEPDGSTPLMIKRAVMKLISKSLMPMYSGFPAPPVPGGPVAKETTDGHSIEYAIASGAAGGMLGIVGDPEVAQIITMYRAPLAMAVPESYEWAV